MWVLFWLVLVIVLMRRGVACVGVLYVYMYVSMYNSLEVEEQGGG